MLNLKDAKDARTLCERFVDSKMFAEQVEAQKCLANVALIGADTVRIEKGDNGDAVLFSEYIPEAIDESLSHLNRGLQLAPQDLTIHQGRLHVLEISRRYDEMTKALDESCKVYRGKEVPDAWLVYAAELSNSQQYEVALKISMVMDKYYPNNSDIIGNIGAFLDILRRDEEAILYLKKAVELAPTDGINVWDLARAYDYANQIEPADQWYQKALSLLKDPEKYRQAACLYAEFVEKKLQNRPRACELQKMNCESEKQTACQPLENSTVKTK